MQVINKKLDYTPPSHYEDMTGQTKAFTYVDHDLPNIVKSVGKSKETIQREEEEAKQVKDWLSNHYHAKIKALLALPAVNWLRSNNSFAEMYVKRNVEEGKIEWDTPVVEGLIYNIPMLDVIFNLTWKLTVKEQHWFTDLSHEEIIDGKWKELI